MKRNYNHRRISAHHLYTLQELSVLLGIDIRTIRRWRRQGLKVVDPVTRPILVVGKEVIRYTKLMRNKRKINLSPEEFFCCRCQKAIRSKDGNIAILFGKMDMLSGNRKAHVSGKCQLCKGIVNRFSSQKQLSILMDTGRLILTDGESLKGQAGHVVNARLRRYDYEQK